ncbi:AAA family ATPase [Streptomyces sp. NPDC008150]|uniref:ParA family protein n=1 Tax=Streptomyces sp. NPDC008150 TaxID=3364816 RepID=UPI0036EFF331
MASPYPDGDREKVASKLPSGLQQQLKVRAAELGLDIQEAVEAAITIWRASNRPSDEIDTAGAKSFSTWLPPGFYDDFKTTCADRNVSYTQGLAQSIRLWLTTNPSPKDRHAHEVRRVIIANQKGGVGKTTITLGMGQVLAEDPASAEANLRGFIENLPFSDLKRIGAIKATLLQELEGAELGGLRVLVVDYDPQSHLTKQLGLDQIRPGQESLIKHMVGDGEKTLREVIVNVDVPGFTGRLDVLPGAHDGFLLDSRLAITASQSRGFQKEVALERALRTVEDDYDVVLIDCPPSLGLAMDAALYYARRRRNELPNRSGVIIPVQAEDSSADAYEMLIEQIDVLCKDLALEIDYLGIVVNQYDARRGYVATSSLDSWNDIEGQTVLAVLDDLKEQREAVRTKRPLLAYAPHSKQANTMRLIAARAGS